MLKRTLSIIAKILAIILTFLTLGLILISFFKPDWIETGITWIGELIQTLGYWNYLIAFSSACLESLPFIGTAVPGMNIMILVGGFWAKDHFAATIVAAILGAMIGNYIGYWIGKYFGKEFIERYGDWFGLGKTEEKILVKQIEKNGFWYIILGKFHNFTRSFVPFIAGSAGMLERNFWLYNMVGSIIWAASINMLGIFFIDNYKMILERLGTVMLVFIVGVILYFYFFKKELLVTYIRDKQNEIDGKVKK